MGFYQYENSCLPCDFSTPCISCLNLNVCLECDTAYILNNNDSNCIPDLTNCTVTRADYTIDPNTGGFMCPDCDSGLSWNFDPLNPGCQLCSTVYENCTTCSMNDCTACVAGYIPVANGQGCQLPIPNCSDNYVNSQFPGYGIDPKEGYFCNQCNLGYFWNATSWSCASCSSSITDCTRCAVNAGQSSPVCTRCSRGTTSS